MCQGPKKANALKCDAQTDGQTYMLWRSDLFVCLIMLMTQKCAQNLIPSYLVQNFRQLCIMVIYAVNKNTSTTDRQVYLHIADFSTSCQKWHEQILNDYLFALLASYYICLFQFIFYFFFMFSGLFIHFWTSGYDTDTLQIHAVIYRQHILNKYQIFFIRQ